MSRAHTLLYRGSCRCFGRICLSMGLLAMLAGGCAREMLITQDPYVNTAMQVGRDAANRTGEPLEINIVCVYPKDLRNEKNSALKPSNTITSADWFERRPIAGDQVKSDANDNRFRLPPEQIFLLTNDRNTYGTVKGFCLRGGNIDGQVATRTFDFNFGDLHDDNAVIYVFGRFVDSEGNVLAVPPAKFHPPGAYGEKLAIKIGVRGADQDVPPDYGQFIEIDTSKCPRKMHGSGD